MDLDYSRLDPSFYRFQYGFYADVSPDGSRVVYSSCEYEDVALGYTHTDYEIATIGIDGTGQRQMTSNMHLDGYPAWSPDGREIAFVGDIFPGFSSGHYGETIKSQEDFGLVIMYADSPPSEGARNLRAGVGGKYRVALYPPVWSPDGQRLAFIAYDGQDEFRPFSSRVLYTVGHDGKLLNRIGETTGPPTWSPDGEHLAFVSGDEQEPGVCVVRYDGTDLRRIWSSGAGEEAIAATQLSWSPDGSEILLVADGVHVVGADGDGHRTLASDAGESTRAAWSPDGSEIAVYYTGSQRTETTEYAYPEINPDAMRLIIMSREGTDRRVLVEMEKDGRLRAVRPTQPEATTEPATDSPTAEPAEPTASTPGQ